MKKLILFSVIFSGFLLISGCASSSSSTPIIGDLSEIKIQDKPSLRTWAYYKNASLPEIPEGSVVSKEVYVNGNQVSFGISLDELGIQNDGRMINVNLLF